MLDELLRPWKDTLLAPLVRATPSWIRPNHVTFLSFIFGVMCIISTALSSTGSYLPLGCFACNRLTDGIDGVLARHQHRQSDYGGFIDLVSDFIVYCFVPVAAAIHVDARQSYISCMILLGMVTLNVLTQLLQSAIIIQAQARTTIVSTTSVPLPAGLVEGFETTLFLTLILIGRDTGESRGIFTCAVLTTFAIAVSINVVQRVLWASKTITPKNTDV
eukprot:PhM_4_TR2716/c0_g1_i1/m.37521